jgi:TolB-like protein/tetratricopeptide (TPR) repeat protein
MAGSARTFWSELKRRHVIKVALAYAAVAFAVGQVADTFLPRLGLADTTVTFVVALLVLGFPVALVLAWAYDLTPTGVVRTSDEEARPSTAVAMPSAPLPDPSRPTTGAAPARGEGGRKSEASPPPTSLVVLPFENLSGDRGTTSFSDGVMEDVLANLCKVRDLHIISRTSAMTYRGTRKSVREIAGELHVGSVLEATVRRADNRVRVVVQLIDAVADRHLWSETYDRDLRDIFSVQSDIAEHIAVALKARLEPDQLARIRRAPTTNLQAYDLLVQGRQLTWRLTGAEHQAGVERLERAIELDPEFALAHAYLAYARAIAPYYAGAPALVAFPEARRAAERALALDEGLSAAWAARAIVRYHHDWDWQGALADLERAASLDPSDADAHHWRGHALSLMRRFDDAVAAHRRSLSLDPHSSLRCQHLGICLFLAGRHAEGFDVLRGAVARDPTFFELHFTLGVCLLHVGQTEDAIATLARAAELSHAHPWANAFYALALHLGSRDVEARRITAAIRDCLEPEGRPGHVGPSALAIAALADGDVESAVVQLENAADRRAPSVLFVRSIVPHPALLRHPRFQSLERRIWS